MGDHLEFKLRIVRTKPEAPGHFWGEESLVGPSAGVVVKSEVVELRVPKGAYVQTWSPRHTPIKTESATETVYRWESSQLRSTAGKKSSDLMRLDTEALELDDHDDRLAQIAWSNFHSWAEVGAWYRGMEGSRMAPDDDVKARVKELTANKTTAEEKARAIYGFVGPQIRYIGVAFGIGRYQPHEATDVLRNQYGDCKDKHTLQAAMLSAAGISSDAVLIGADESFIEELPTPGRFNHVITLAHIDGKPEWLDATAEVAAYQLLMPSLRGKRVLVVPPEGEAHLDTTPAVPPFALEDRYTADGSIDDQGLSKSKMTMELHGETEVAFRQAVRSVSPAQWDELMQKISESLSYAGKVSDTQFSRADDLSSPLHVTYSYEREKAGDWPNLKIVPQLTPIGLGPIDKKDLPVLPIQFGSPRVEISHAVMKIPAGWGAELPAPVHAKSDFLLLDKTYKFDKGTITVDRRYQVLQKRIPASRWQDYETWYKAASMDGESYIQLTRTAGSRKITAYNQEAAQLVSEAVDLERQHKWDEVKKKLDEAKALNNQQAFLWSNYGFVAQQYGMPKEAEEDFKKEIAEHPEEAIPYRLLAINQRMLKHADDAIATLRKLLIVHPEDVQGNGLLSSMLSARNDYAGAESVLKSAIELNKDSDSLKLALGTALLHEGKKNDAKKTFADLAANSTDPMAVNNAAYSLANESLDLALADAAAKRALTLLEDAILAKSGSENDALQRASLLVSLWDTLGWILFEEGKTSEAEPYLRAAWLQGQSAEVGLHMGELLEKQGKTSEAAKMYALAQEGERGSEAEEVARKISDHIAKLPTQANLLSLSEKPLQKMRTFKVKKPVGMEKAWGTISFEISTSGAVENIQVLKGDEALDAAARVVPSINFNLPMPPNSKAPLLREAVVSCGTQPECMVVLVPPDGARQE